MRNKEKRNAYSKEWRRLNPDKVRANNKRYFLNHREESIQRILQWDKENPDRLKNARKRHAAKNAAKASETKALRIMAMPPWVKREDLAAFHVEARRLTLTTGIPHQVDHIWPLRGNGFIGLHVPWNLRVISAFANRSKGNKRPDGVSV